LITIANQHNRVFAVSCNWRNQNISIITAYLIAHWSYLEIKFSSVPDWGQAAQTALVSIFPEIVVSLLLLDIEHLAPIALSQGFDIHISRCKI
jgi:hypothetical protein